MSVREWESGFAPVDRREFLQALGAGVLVLVAASDLAALEHIVGGEPQAAAPPDFNAYLHIAEDGRVTVFSGKIEMGQGVTTSMAQMAAEELGVAVESIDMVMGDTASCPFDQGTWGSLTTRAFGPVLRAAAAEAREVLLQLGAERLGVSAGQLRVHDGAVEVVGAPDRKVTFGQLTAGKRIERRLGHEAVLKAARDFTVMGKPHVRLEAVAKVTGAAKFAGDIRVPGMLCARILRPPAHGATLKRVDTSAARRVPGVTVVEQPDLVAVLHEDPEQAEQALKLVQADFDEPAGGYDENTIHAHLVEAAPTGQVLSTAGSLEAGRAGSNTVVETAFQDSYYAHAPIETHTALAQVEGDHVTLWVSTQSPFGDRQRVARALGLPTESVRVITPWVGGGFGGKGSNDQAVEAARLARATGKPVQVMWTRAEEFFNDTFRPAAVVKIASGIDGTGHIAFWSYDVYAAGGRGAEVIYDVAHRRITAHPGGWTGPAGYHPFATGPWRAPGNSTNTFARESQIDIMAARAGLDPVEFRLRNLRDPRARSVLDAVAARFGWKKGAAPSGRGVGVAISADADTYVAHMAEVDVDRASGRIRVKRIVCAQEMGIVVNPEGATLQMEGCLTMGLGYALAEQVRFRGGRVLEQGFGTYRVPRFSWLPELETVIVRNDEHPPAGGGEPAIVGVGAVIANAVFDATGARVLALPLLPERVQAAMTAAGAKAAPGRS